MSSGIHRKRLACVECTRRKVKCDKNLPCRNCARKGTPCTRPRERASPTPSVAPSVGHEQHFFIRSSADSLQMIHRLQSRVDRLESALKEATKTASPPSMPMPEVQFNSNSFTPAESVSINASPRSLQTSTPTVQTIHTETLNTPNEVEDAATILDFLVWGRRKDPTYHDEIAKRNNIEHSPGDVPTEDEWDDSQKVYQLVDYHCTCLLWYHGAFHAKTFMQELGEFYEKGDGRIDGSLVNLQWVSLLFAVLTGSMASAPSSIAQSWGFRGRERNSLSKRRLKASIACLHEADYMACHSIYSVQAIATLTITAHMLGQSNGFSVLLASGVRIAQGLGLHQLGEGSDSRATDVVSREIGRRIWCQLCIQDWFSIPFTESYLIHRLAFSTKKPQNCDNDIQSLPEDHPTVTSYSRLFYDIAALMPDLQDDVTLCNTLYTKYEEVLKYDRRLRILATRHLPLAISSAHKVIMIHREFLSLSFVNPTFEFTRKTCAAASRTIIKEQKEATRDGGPMLWIHQAFSVTASIILCLEIRHQPGPDRQSAEHRQLVEDGIEILTHCESEMIGRRGVFLLRAMLDAEQNKSRERRQIAEIRESQSLGVDATHDGMDIAGVIRTFYQRDRASSARPMLPGRPSRKATGHENWTEKTSDVSGMMPNVDFIAPLGVDYAEGLEDILSLATNYLN
ncbi:uncharacterized protein N7477_002078 [Penicillium maclennaniae]|uniref:uncharacterized protein n=1 Tax=Penicillium maclennaniae TaxID=1343394 RepID=UPI0025418BD2|nr:uncharacterized protein N7477_002078 [Penicillium maclennaniae]KAJ5682138.1 hypothetical protein N7477_002078 [Penicillium maclennaniae]